MKLNYFLAFFAAIQPMLDAEVPSGSDDANGRFMLSVVECLSLISESTDEAQMLATGDLNTYLRHAEKSAINGNDVCDKMKAWFGNNNPTVAEAAADLYKAGSDVVLLGQSAKAWAEATSKDQVPEILAKTKAHSDDLQKRTFAAVALVKNNDEQRVLHVHPEAMQRVIVKIETLFAGDVKNWNRADEEVRSRFLNRTAALNAMMIRSEYQEQLLRRVKP